MAGKVVFWIVSTAMVLWFVVPLTVGIFAYFSDQIRDARDHDEPVSSVFVNAGNGCIALIIKGVVIIVGLVLLVTVGSFVLDIFSGPSYGPDYEAWRR